MTLIKPWKLRNALMMFVATMSFLYTIEAISAVSGSPEVSTSAPPILNANQGKSTNIKNVVEDSGDSSSQRSIDSIAQKLTSVKLKQIPSVVDDIIANVETKSQENLALAYITALLEGELYFRKSDSQIFIAKATQGKTFDLYGVEDKTLVEKNIAKRAIKKVRSSNKVRKALRISIAKLQLNSDDINQRIESISNLMASIDPQALALLEEARLKEPNSKVKDKLDDAIALGNLASEDELKVVNALEHLKGNLEPEVRNAITKLLNRDLSEKNLKLANKTLDSIESKVKLNGYIERIFFGLSLGSILLLVAAGLAITFGVMGVINMAHGELIMIGAYTTYVVQLMMPNHIEYSLLVALPAAFIVSGLFGIGIERGVIQFLKGRPLETLLATFGISLVLQQLVRTVFSPLNRQVVSPEFMSGALQINPVLSLTYNRIYILIFALVVFFLLQLLMRKTSLGLNVRAVSQNRDMARAMGIKSKWVDAMTFGLGSGIAGLAGVALTQVTNVGPNLGQSYIIDSFMVVVFGGVGNLWGTLVGAFTVGALNKFLEPVTGTVLSTIIVLVLIILFIQRRPRGLFPQKGRSAES